MNSLIESLAALIVEVKDAKTEMKDFDEKFLSGLETQLDWARKRQMPSKKKAAKRKNDRKECIYKFTKASKKYGQTCGKGCKHGVFCGLHKHSKQAKKHEE